jgi:hypothetical protein
MKNILPALAVCIILSSCSSTRWMSLSVLEPAPVTISPDVKKVAVINRSLPDTKVKVLDAIEKVFSLEGANLDKEGAAATIFSLTNELQLSKRFTEVKQLDFNGKGNNNPGTYPSPLDWAAVEELCEHNHSDILFSLELFDTDSKIAYAAQPVKVNTPLGSVPAVHQQATMTTRVKAGWRIYDPYTKKILDESAVSRHLVFRASGLNPTLAASALISRKEAVRQVGSNAGEAYAYSVIPQWLRVSREYFVRGNDQFKVARRRAESGNWDGAGDIWNEQTRAAKSKVAGRACYNMAIISEINGDLDAAISWAQKSYEDYNIKLALRYVRVLQNRKVSNSILEEQQGTEVARSGDGDDNR